MPSRIDIENVKDRAGEAGDVVLSFAEDQLADFRGRSVYFQLKAGLILVYALIAIVTLVIMVPTPADFEMKIRRVDFGMSDRIGLEIKNTEMGDLEDVRVVLEGFRTSLEGSRVAGKWSASLSNLRVDEPVTIAPGEFRDEKGLRANYSIDVVKVLVYEEGELRGQVKVKKAD